MNADQVLMGMVAALQLLLDERGILAMTTATAAVWGFAAPVTHSSHLQMMGGGIFQSSRFLT